MFDIDVEFDDIVISSIEKEEVMGIEKWFNSQHSEGIENREPVRPNEFYKRFLESYVSESEFFLKIIKKDSFIGIIKGRVEFKSTNEVWVWCFILDENYRNRGLGSKIMNSLERYFYNYHGIENMYSVTERNNHIIRFLKKNQYSILRTSKDFFSRSEGKLDMLIFGKKIKAY